MGCRCGGHYVFVDGQLRCFGCGKLAPFQPVPDHKQLLIENAKMKERIAELERLLEGSHRI